MKAHRILKYGTWWEHPTKYKDYPSQDSLILDHFRKVIFLDIDGVLNDEGREVSKGIYINPEMVRWLRFIVNETNAEIVLTSSWRYLYGSYALGGFTGADESMEQLLKTFDSMCLQVPGATPMFFNGPYGRPYEIRTWLSQRPEVESFVILDDETFWLWNWLEHNFVCTTVRNEDGRETIGLDEKGARRAVRILNRKLKYTDTRQTRGIF